MKLGEYRDSLSPYDQRIFDEMCDAFVETAIQLLLESGTDDDTIKLVIAKHWNISTSDLTSILVNEKIKAAQQMLKEYMEQIGYSEHDIKVFISQNMVGAKLRNEHDLLLQWKNPEKIYKAVQKKKKSQK